MSGDMIYIFIVTNVARLTICISSDLPTERYLLSGHWVEVGIFEAVTSEGLLVSGSLAVLCSGLKDVAWKTLV